MECDSCESKDCTNMNNFTRLCCECQELPQEKCCETCKARSKSKD